MVTGETKELSIVTTDEFLEMVGFSAEELNLEYLTDIVICLSGVAYAMRLLYPIEGSKAVERHFEANYELAMEALGVIDYSKKASDDLIRDGVRGFIIESLWGIQPDVPKEREEEFIAKYRQERRWEIFPQFVAGATFLIYHGRTCFFELGKRLSQNMHAVEALMLRDGIEHIKMRTELHSFEERSSGLTVPVKKTITTGERLKNECLKSLMGELDRSASRVKLLWDSDDMRQELIDKLLVEEIKPKLMTQWDFRTTIHQALEGELRHLPKHVKDRLKNVRDKQHREVERFESYDRTMKNTNGETTTRLEILESEDKATHPDQTDEIDEGFTQAQLDALDKELSPIGREIFVYRYQHQEIIGRGEGKILAQALGYAPATVSKYLKVIADKAAVIQNIMRG